MRLSLINYPLTYEDASRSNFAFNDAESTLGSDLVIIDLAAAFAYYSNQAPREYRNLPSFGDSLTARFVADIQRRSREFREVLNGNGTIVVMTPPPLKSYLDTGRRNYSGTGRNRHETVVVDEYNFLSVLPIKLETAVGKGRNFSFRNDEIGSILRSIEKDIEYHAIIASRVSSVIGTIAGTPSVVSAVLLSDNLSGRILLLPQIRSEDDYDSEAEWISAGDRYLDAAIAIHERNVINHEAAPSWARQYQTVFERELHERLAELQDSLKTVSTAIRAVDQSLGEANSWKILLFGSGRELEVGVANALTALGVRVEEGEQNRTDLVLHWKGKAAVAEVKGLTKSASESNAVQTEKWVSEYHANQNVEPKGLLIVNPFRMQPLMERKERPFPAQMMKYVKRKELALLTTQQLFVALQRNKNEPDVVERFIDSLFSSVGIVEAFSDWTDVLAVVAYDGEEAHEETPFAPSEAAQ